MSIDSQVEPEQVRPPQVLILNIVLEDEGKRRAHITVDSAYGFSTQVVGKLYPREVLLLSKIMELLRERKDTYTPMRKAVRS